jgi:hypothetical protein
MCTDEHLHESVTIVRAAPLLQVKFESGCVAEVQFDARRAFPNLQSLGAGNQVDAELWHPSASLQDPQLWLILKQPDTGELLFTVYQKPWDRPVICWSVPMRASQRGRRPEDLRKVDG